MKFATIGKCAKNPRYVVQKNKARKNELPGLFLVEPSFTSTLYGGGGLARNSQLDTSQDVVLSTTYEIGRDT
ncbi:MAG: hypothetical protein ACI814_004682, partial [Mariniblastus sp.]